MGIFEVLKEHHLILPLKLRVILHIISFGHLSYIVRCPKLCVPLEEVLWGEGTQLLMAELGLCQGK